LTARADGDAALSLYAFGFLRDILPVPTCYRRRGDEQPRTLRALFGGALQGYSPVYYVYVDEAGTSANEPVSVVVGVIVHADTQWRAAAQALSATVERFVPRELRHQYVFHAKAVFNGDRRSRTIWPKEDRVSFIHAVLEIPKRLGLAIALGKVRRDAGAPWPIENLTVSQKQHLFAFGTCLARVDKHLREYGENSEVATVVAEDVPQMRRFLKKAVSVYRHESFDLQTHVPARPTLFELTAGIIVQTNAGAIKRIIGTVHFVEKDEAPLLQLADACAFAFRRYFAEQEHGAEWVKTLLGHHLVWHDWQGPASNWVFRLSPES
jgi:hypothetical protein